MKIAEHQSKMDWKSKRIWEKTIEIASDWLQRFRMEGAAKQHLQ